MKRFQDISASDYLASCKPRFGTANPERMPVSVWEWMVRTHQDPYLARQSLNLESNHAPPGNPDWCFVRMGAPQVKMSDGRIITIGGEHEDFYDPDFCIYNDVVVQQEDQVEIYGYPRSVFPPTDFHTVTLVGTKILIVGSLGYPRERSPALTPVFCLETSDYRLERVACTGESPGWIHKHQSEYLTTEGALEVTGGQVLFARGDTSGFRDNVDTYRLHLADRIWSRVTDNSGWRHFSLKYSDDDRTLGDLGWYSGDVLKQLGYPCELYADDDEDEDRDTYRPHVLRVNGVPVQCSDRYGEIRVIIQGTLAQADIDRVLVELQDAARRTHRVVKTVDEL